MMGRPPSLLTRNQQLWMRLQVTVSVLPSHQSAPNADLIALRFRSLISLNLSYEINSYSVHFNRRLSYNGMDEIRWC